MGPPAYVMACGPYADHFQLPLRQFERWAMMILGFGGVGFMAYGRRLLAVWSPMATRSLTVELNLAFTTQVRACGIGVKGTREIAIAACKAAIDEWLGPKSSN